MKTVAAIDLRYRCKQKYKSHYLCESKISIEDGNTGANRHHILQQTNMTANLSLNYIQCPRGHVTHRFLACDAQAACWTGINKHSDEHDAGIQAWCAGSMGILPPPFWCRNQIQDVPYTFVCDHRHDCQDGSDENFCIFPACPSSAFIQCSTTPQVKVLRRGLILNDQIREIVGLIVINEVFTEFVLYHNLQTAYMTMSDA